MEPNKPPLAMTIGQMFERLTVAMESATHEERQTFKKIWLQGAERMNRETARLREERVSR